MDLPNPWDDIALSDGYLKCGARGKVSLALRCKASMLDFVLDEILQGVSYRYGRGVAGSMLWGSHSWGRSGSYPAWDPRLNAASPDELHLSVSLCHATALLLARQLTRGDAETLLPATVLMLMQKRSRWGHNELAIRGSEGSPPL